MLLTVVLEKTLESSLYCKEIKPVNLKGNQSWIFIGRTDAEAETQTLATWYEELTHWKRLWFWERLTAGGEGDGRSWESWMASLTWWTWVWVRSRSWWWTGEPGVLQPMVLQRVGHDWMTELNWIRGRRIILFILISMKSTLIWWYLEKDWNAICIWEWSFSAKANQLS